jgi:hypothetical protein
MVLSVRSVAEVSERWKMGRFIGEMWSGTSNTPVFCGSSLMHPENKSPDKLAVKSHGLCYTNHHVIPFYRPPPVHLGHGEAPVDGCEINNPQPTAVNPAILQLQPAVRQLQRTRFCIVGRGLRQDVDLTS